MDKKTSSKKWKSKEAERDTIDEKRGYNRFGPLLDLPVRVIDIFLKIIIVMIKL